MEYLQPNFDKTILKAMDPRSKMTDAATKERIRKKLIEKGSMIWERNKARLREQREARKIRKEDN